MTVSASRAKCLAGGSPHERRVRQQLLAGARAAAEQAMTLAAIAEAPMRGATATSAELAAACRRARA